MWDDSNSKIETNNIYNTMLYDISVDQKYINENKFIYTFQQRQQFQYHIKESQKIPTGYWNAWVEINS